MSYTTYDFSETLSRANIDRADVARVLEAWGKTGDYAEWNGGFLLEMVRSDRYDPYLYVTGWCDTTGWGCQDGVEVIGYSDRPNLADIESEAFDVDHYPADLERYIQTGEGRWE